MPFSEIFVAHTLDSNMDNYDWVLSQVCIPIFMYNVISANLYAAVTSYLDTGYPEAEWWGKGVAAFLNWHSRSSINSSRHLHVRTVPAVSFIGKEKTASCF